LCAVFSVVLSLSWVATDLYSEYVYPPETKEEIAQAMGPFFALAMNGATGSMDGVHAAWGACPHDDLIHFRNHKGYNSILYNVSCTHDGRIMSVAGGAPGRNNDKFVVKRDLFAQLLRTDPLWRSVQVELLTNTGVKRRRGVTLLVDGGYLRWVVTVPAPPIPTTNLETMSLAPLCCIFV
jgi:hypothetical protein